MGRKMAVGFSLLGILLVYDMVSASNTYLHMARFNQTFNIGDLHQIQHLLQLLKWPLLLIAIKILAVTIMVMFTRILKNVSPLKKKNSFIDLSNFTLSRVVYCTFVFLALFLRWVVFIYKDYSDIHRAIMFVVVFSVVRIVGFFKLFIILALDVQQLQFLADSIEYLFLCVLAAQSSGFKLIDTIC